MRLKNFQELLKKYDIPVPRYTSYPTVPAWSQTPSPEQWIQDIRQTMSPSSAGWAIYIHVPFCESLCTFCGCNNIITKDHKRETSYVDLLLKEWQTYKEAAPELVARSLQMLHLGGGTPTFLSAGELNRLLSSILEDAKIRSPDFEASIEVDPRRTNMEQLTCLRKLGFNRISLGVQDFNEEVQRLVNRNQPFSTTERITRGARELGYNSVNFDLIYGLPRQNEELMNKTLDQTLSLRPDRIAFYSFALVPWIKPQQRIFKDEDLPTPEMKRLLYEIARERFLKAGYLEVGMDHFALPTDKLFTARQEGRLHRNFMGYTDQRSDLLLGLGVSSISESKNQFHQNEKLLPKYQEPVLAGKIATHRGHILSSKDQEQRKKILEMMTSFKLELSLEDYSKVSPLLVEFIDEGLIQIYESPTSKTIEVLEAGRPFLRNICSVFDDYIVREPQGAAAGKKLFSKSI